jgi:hypothetical protein
MEWDRVRYVCGSEMLVKTKNMKREKEEPSQCSASHQHPRLVRRTCDGIGYQKIQNMPKGVSCSLIFCIACSPLLCITTTIQHIQHMLVLVSQPLFLSGLRFDLFCAGLAQLGIHLVEVAIYELST